MRKYTPTSNSTQVFIYNPEGWDPKSSLPRDLHEREDVARYFVHRIFMGRIIDRSHRDDLVPLKAEYMREIITDPDVYMAVKDALVRDRTIVTDNQYVVGSKCKGYKLGPKLHGLRHVRTEVTDKFIAGRIVARRRKEVEQPKPEVYSYLDSWLHKVEIDQDGANSHLLFNNEFHQHRDGRHEASIRLIADKEWFSTVCNQGRYHSNVSCLESSLRQFLRLNGSPLVNLDIRNSQPLIFGSLVLNSLSNDGFLSSVHSFLGEIKNLKKTKVSNNFQKFKLSLLPSNPSPTPSLYDVKNCPTDGENRVEGKKRKDRQLNDVDKYLQLCQEGNFYNFLMERANYPQDESLRRQFKQNFFKETFFCENKFEGKAAGLFKEEFPNVYEVLRQLKSRDYKTPSLCLQRAESDLIINRAVRRLRDESPTIPVLTVHDSIMTTEPHAHTVMQVMLDSFATVGLVPTIKVTPA